MNQKRNVIMISMLLLFLSIGICCLSISIEKSELGSHGYVQHPSFEDNLSVDYNVECVCYSWNCSKDDIVRFIEGKYVYYDDFDGCYIELVDEKK